MLKLYSQTSNLSIRAKDFVLKNPNVDGIVINVPVTPLIGIGGEFSQTEGKKLTDAVKENAGYNKKSAISINFGNYIALAKPKDVRFLKFYEARYNDSKRVPVPLSVPVFFDAAYMEFIEKFFVWIKNLFIYSDTYKYVEYIKISPVGYYTFEMRVPDYDNTGTGDAYRNAASKWLSVGWTNDKVRETLKSIIDLFYQIYPDKVICLAVIGGISGSCCVGDNEEICLPAQRANIGKEMVEYGLQYPLFAPSTTAIAAHSGTPSYVYRSGAAHVIGQLAESIYAPLNSQVPDPKAAIENARNNNVTILETFENSLRDFPNQNQ